MEIGLLEYAVHKRKQKQAPITLKKITLNGDIATQRGGKNINSPRLVD